MSGWISSKLKVAETLLQQIDQQAAESLRKNEASRSDDELSDVKPNKKSSDILPPLKDQLKKKNKKTDIVGNVRNDGNLKVVEGNEVNVNPRPSLTDSDWTELLNAPSKTTVNGRLPGLLKDGKRQVQSGSNLLALDRKKSQAVHNRSGRRSDVTLGDKVNGDVNPGSDSSQSTQSSVGLQSVAQNVSGGSAVVDNSNGENHENILPKMQSDVNPVSDLKVEANNEQKRLSKINVSRKADIQSASDGELNSESDSDSTSDSESEREREERRKRREKILAEKAVAKAIEAIKDRENLVARLEGEKQSLEKIIDERAKQQAREASELQMTMMETMDAVDLEKQKHNNTRMEALMKLAKLETTNAELAKSLATAQWSLEVEVKRVAELHRQIELKEASHEELTSKKRSHLSGNKLTASKGVEFEHEILEAEHTFVTDKLAQLQDKAKTLETSIEITRKEMENPTEVEVELKRRLGQLTDHLIQKQAQVEALSSEKAMLMFKMEAVSRSLEENKSSVNVNIKNDLESGVVWDLSNSRLKPIFEERLRKGQKHIGSLVRQLDSIFSTGATFLRRNPSAKVWSFVYLICLHLWVLYILRSHTPVSDSGAVISLENIHNNTSSM